MVAKAKGTPRPAHLLLGTIQSLAQLNPTLDLINETKQNEIVFTQALHAE